MKIVLLEDESIVIHDLKLRLTKLGYDVVGTFDNGADFLRFFETNNADICVVDIHINGELNGIETVERLNDKNKMPVIYLTAQADVTTFEQARETKPFAYLLKPYNDFELQSTIELAIENFEVAVGGNDKELQIVDDKIFVKNKNRFERIDIKQIQFLEASGNYTEINTENNKYLVVTQLGKFESALTESYFYRCHRSFIINLQCVDGFDDANIYIGEKQIPISKNNKKDFLDRLRII